MRHALQTAFKYKH